MADNRKGNGTGTNNRFNCWNLGVKRYDEI